MTDLGDTIRLAKPKRKGILSLIFSRFFIIIVVLAAEIAAMLLPFFLLREYLHYAMGALILFTLVMLIYLFNSSMDSTAKLTWMFIIAILQIAGALMLLYTQANTGHRFVRDRAAAMINATKDTIHQDPVVLKKLHEEDSYTDDLVRYLNRSGCFPVYEKTETRYFPSGEAKFEAMLSELEKAEKYIFMEYFIIEEGHMWGRILKILREKAKAGVDVRVMYDGMCEISTLPANYCKLLEAEGIKAKSFAPIRPFLSSHYNYRDHRKICVIDGKTAFNGGVNLADEYINEIERFGHWKDTAVMLKGDAVQSFTLMFLQMWNIDEKRSDFSEAKVPYSTLIEEERGTLSGTAAAENAAHALAEQEEAPTHDQTEQEDAPAHVFAEQAETSAHALAEQEEAPTHDQTEQENVPAHVFAEQEEAEENGAYTFTAPTEKGAHIGTAAEENAASGELHPSGYVVPYCDCPLDEDKVGETVYMDVLNRAGKYVHIMTPYLILDGELETALKYAGQRGIDVKLILPGIPDKKIAYSLAKAHYKSLLQAGVKIYEYTPGFVHAKVCVSDDEKGIVGTINFDYRSLYHHFECATYMYKTDCIPDLENDFQETLAKCRQVTEQTIKDEALFYKVVGPVVKFVAPLM